jgi:aspartyl-tRNA(Asn)/glutamyl-tRNA(Gln) amidotransferase subunit A
MKNELNKLTLKEASEKLASGEITSVELTEACLDEIEDRDGEIHAFLNVLKEEAMVSAIQSDELFKKSGQRRSRIDGVPIAVKDNMCMVGTLTTAASKILENFVAPYDATVIKKLKDAGAVIIGKTNLDEFAMGSSTENSAYGPTKNPHDLERVPGGSSGGSAAAVAANMCIAALGSDTGGSIRQPAAFCGIVGLKPTYGSVSRYGLMAMASSLDQIGPMTKTAEDAQILFDIIAGYDEKDSTSVKSEIQNPKSACPNQNAKLVGETNSRLEMKSLKLGVPKEYFSEGLDPEVKRVIDESILNFKKMGAKIIDISLPHAKYALSCYYIIMPVEVASNLGRYDGIKYGFSAEAENLLDKYLNSRSEGFGAEVKRRVILGTYTSSAGYIDQYYNQAQKARALIKQDFDQAFEKVDFILGPVMPTTAFKIGEKSDDPLAMYLSDIYTISVNLAGLPAISIPAGKSNNLPVGLHIIGPQMSDLKILELAKKFENNQ